MNTLSVIKNMFLYMIMPIKQKIIIIINNNNYNNIIIIINN